VERIRKEEYMKYMLSALPTAKRAYNARKKAACNLIMVIVETFVGRRKKNWTLEDKNKHIYDLLDLVGNTVQASGEQEKEG